MSHTNVHIPSKYDSTIQLQELIDELQCKIKWLNRQLDYYDTELQNIPKAIIEHGFVNITYEKQTLKIGKIP